MTPKEKAKELIEKFHFQKGFYLHWDTAKQCALIAVDEILDALKGLVFGIEYINNSDYWEQVKIEIENL